MKHRLLLLLCSITTFFALTLGAPAAFADQFLAGISLGADPGQPDFDERRPTFFAGYEARDLWRFTFHSSAFDNDLTDTDLDVTLLSAERMWVYEMGSNFLLIGTMGPGFYSASVDNATGEESGSGIGLVGGGSFRIWFGEAFADFGFQYRNAGVTIGDGTVNGGYQGFAISGGIKL